jgi:chromosome segregation ATPase
MPEQLETLTLGENELRLERIKLPNGNTYVLGCSFEEAQDIYDVLNENIEAVNEDVEDLKVSERVIAASLNDLNSRVVALTAENTQLRNEIALLTQEIALIKRNYMAYYDVDESKGIGEQNVYTR